MEHSTVILLLAVTLLLVVLIFGSGPEAFGEHIYTAESSVDCSKFPDSPACQDTPDVDPTSTELDTCNPSDGKWSIAGTGAQGRSTLNSPCCQPPKYAVAKDYKTCDSNLGDGSIDKCIKTCCQFVTSEANNYDASWYPMARCACSMWCNNQHVPHFAKYGTAVHYISGDLAEAKTGDSSDFIGGGGDFSGGV